MEENIAILIADLSGYTALTEAHGAASAADLIDKYIRIVEDCLIGNSKLKERTGDEVMIVSSCADHLLTTAIMIMKNTSNEDNFLQVHGGLHYGTVLKRNNSYFGSTINLTARIAAEADPGSFLCSADFIDALNNKSVCTFLSKGNYRFKNVNQEKEVSEIVNKDANLLAIDPTCKMLILDKSIAIRHPEKADLFFCSQTCLDIFEKYQTAHPKIDR
jgi:class 3 adenylate cyclase/YHS domain-containing protein